MYEEIANDDFGLFSFLNLESSRLNAFEELDFELLDKVPEFSLERTTSRSLAVAPPLPGGCDSSSEKLPAEVETHSTSDHSAPLFSGQQRAMSVLSFDSDAGAEELTPIQNSDPSAEGFDKLLLKMVDQENLDFLLSMAQQGGHLDEKLKEFLSCNIEVMTKTAFPNLPNETSLEWITRANNHLSSTTKKRKDQKLRMIFNKIVKMLINGAGRRESGRESKASRQETFLDKYAKKMPTEFDSAIRDCKFPSKKKLKSVFRSYPLFRQEVEQLLVHKVFYNEYLAKRQVKAQRLVHHFAEAQKKFGHQSRSKVVASLRDCIKSFPWSVQDLSTSCELLHSTLGEQILLH